MAGNTNPNAIGEVANFIAHFTGLSTIALEFLRSIVNGVATSNVEVTTTPTQLISGKSGASFVPLELVISTQADLTLELVGQRFQIDDGLRTQTFNWDDYTPDLVQFGVVRISLAGLSGLIARPGLGINFANLLSDNVGMFVKISLIGFYDA